MTRVRLAARSVRLGLLVALPIAVGVACAINPQPIPPLEGERSTAPTADGGPRGDTGAGFGGENDCGAADAGGPCPPGTGSDDSGGANGDAGTLDGGDAGTLDAGASDGGDAQALDGATDANADATATDGG
jgi:hypothetical protein